MAVLVGALLPLGAGAGAATVDPPGARAVTDACPVGDVPAHGFTDVAPGDVHEAAIACLAWYGVTSGGPAGLGPTEYGPDLTVRRDQMASFIVRVIDYANPDLLRDTVRRNAFPCDSDPDSALTEDNVHYLAVQRLALAGIVAGGPAGAEKDCYGADLMVTRAQMASFIDRALELLSLRPLTSSTDFYDDDDGNAHEPSIEAITEVGIAQGPGDRRFDPGAPVTRAQMASFLVRSLEFLVDGTLAFPPGAARPEPGQALVALDDPSLEAGGEVTGTITGADVVFVIVSGCGFENQPIDDTAGEMPGIQFAEALPEAQPEGVCTLAFATSFRDGALDTARFSITVGEVVANSATITLDGDGDGDVVEAGEVVTGEITGADIASATVSGCGLADEPVADVGVPEFFRFEETIPVDQPIGTCDLTFITTFAGGATDTDTVTIRVTRRGTVTITTPSVPAGGALRGTISGAVRSASVSGCGLVNQRVREVANTDPESFDGFAFTVPIPEIQPSGECGLTFTTTVSAGETVVDTATITVTAATGS